MKLNRLTTAALLAAGLAVSPSAQAVDVYGSLGSSDNYKLGIVKFQSDGDGEYELVYEYAGMECKNGSVFTDGMFSFSSYDTSSSYLKPELKRYTHDGSYANWTQASYIERLDWTDASTALAYNPLSGFVAGCFYNADKATFFFGTLDVETGKSTRLGDLSVKLVSMAYDANGTLYAIDGTGALYTVAADGALTKVGDTSVTVTDKYASGMVYDKSTGKFLWAAKVNTYSAAKLYTVDPATAAATEVFTFTHTALISALTLDESVADTAPQAAADLAIVAADDTPFTNNVKITFTVADKTVAGSTISAGVTYEIFVDGVKATSAMTAPGSAIEYPVTLAGGKHTVSVRFSTAKGGTSAITRVAKFIGQDRPGTVSNVVVSRDGKNITLTWDAPTTGANGGEFDTAQLKYKVVRMPANVEVETTSTSFSETIEGSALQSIYYEITPLCGEQSGDMVASQSLVIGDGYATPYTQDFSDAESLDDIFFSVINANDDDKTWTLNSGWSGASARYSYSSTNKADDWLVMPPVILRPGHTYKLSFNGTAGSWTTGEELTVAMGTDANAAALSTVIMETTTFAKGTTAKELTFTVPAYGIYYIGFHITTEADSHTFDIDDIVLGDSEGKDVPTAVPAAVTDLTAATAEDSSIGISFTVPTTDVNGNAPVDLDKIELFRDGTLIKSWDVNAIADVTTGVLSFYDMNAVVTSYDYTYSVIATNAAGASEAATVNIKNSGSGVDNAAAEGVRVAAGNGFVTVSATDGTAVAVYDLTGRRVYNAAVTDGAAVARLAAGIYVVAVDGKTVKVVVR